MAHFCSKVVITTGLANARAVNRVAHFVPMFFEVAGAWKTACHVATTAARAARDIRKFERERDDDDWS